MAHKEKALREEGFRLHDGTVLATGLPLFRGRAPLV